MVIGDKRNKIMPLFVILGLVPRVSGNLTML